MGCQQTKDMCWKAPLLMSRNHNLKHESDHAFYTDHSIHTSCLAYIVMVILQRVLRSRQQAKD